MSMTDELAKLDDLLERGFITQEEYDAQKAVLASNDATPEANPEDLLAGHTRMVSSSDPILSESAPAAPEANPEDLLAGRTRMVSSSDPILASNQGNASPTTNAPAIGSILNERYIITRKLGEGGMGVIFQAMDQDTDQDVAVKIISPQLAEDPEVLSALRREVATARKLGAHPNLLRILDIHLRESPPFFTMEAVLGGDLHEYWLAQSRKLQVKDATRLLTQVLEGLKALEEARVVHQDIKPQNILLAKDGSIRITDYGISRSIKEQLTQGGADGSGTLAYMAPEQLNGEICDRRTDVYAVGIMAYQLLTGKFPFAGTSEEEVQEWHRTGSRELDGLPQPYGKIIPKMIAIAPEDRFRSAAEVIKALKSDTPAATPTQSMPSITCHACGLRIPKKNFCVRCGVSQLKAGAA